MTLILTLLLITSFSANAASADIFTDFISLFNSVTGNVVFAPSYTNCYSCTNVSMIWCEDGSGSYENVCMSSDPYDMCGQSGGDQITDINKCSLGSCGNDVCESFEDCSSCYEDCGRCNSRPCTSDSQCASGNCVHYVCRENPYPVSYTHLRAHET